MRRSLIVSVLFVLCMAFLVSCGDSGSTAVSENEAIFDVVNGALAAAQNDVITNHVPIGRSMLMSVPSYDFDYYFIPTYVRVFGYMPAGIPGQYTISVVFFGYTKDSVTITGTVNLTVNVGAGGSWDATYSTGGITVNYNAVDHDLIFNYTINSTGAYSGAYTLDGVEYTL